MSLEFIGYVPTRSGSEALSSEGPVVDRAYIEMSARTHEEAGFDRVLVAFHSTGPESLLISAHAAAAAPKLGIMIAHRPGFTAPTLAARQFATLDQLTGGRVAIHVISGGNDAESGRMETTCLTTSAMRVRKSIWRWSAKSGQAPYRSITMAAFIALPAGFPT